MSAFTARMDPPSTLKPSQVTTWFIEAGIAKHNTRPDKIFFKAFMAGIMLSFGGLLSELVGGGSAGLTESNPGLAKLLAGFVFPVGLVMIILLGYELLTSNMMIFPMCLVQGVIPWYALPLNWILVFFGNLTGSLFVGAILTKYSGVLSDAPYNAYVVAFALHKAQEPAWYQIFLRGIGCNWLVCIAVWHAAGARDTLSKIVGTWFPIWVFVAVGFDHVIANMYSVPLGIMFGADISVAYYIRKSLIASFIGNVIGGCLFGLPMLYFYPQLFGADFGLRAAEEGAALSESAAGVQLAPVAGASTGSSFKRADEMYEAPQPVVG